MRMIVCKITTDVESRMRTRDNRISNRKSNVAFSNSLSVGWMGPIGHYSFFGPRVFGKKVQQYMFIPFQFNNVNGMVHGATVFRNSSCNIWWRQPKYGHEIIAQSIVICFVEQLALALRYRSLLSSYFFVRYSVRLSLNWNQSGCMSHSTWKMGRF